MTLYIGCPIWGSKRWLGTFFPAHTPTSDFLFKYSQQLPTVEGNTTFYAQPSVERLLQWKESTPKGFRFCLKMPRTITHVAQLQNCEALTSTWMNLVRLLEDRAGPHLLQLPSSFSPMHFPRLVQYLQRLPKNLQFAVEVRHGGFFLPHVENQLNAVLQELNMARVLYDVRGLQGATGSDPTVRAALERKPNVPVRFVQTANFVMVRFISHPIPEENRGLLEEWALHVVPWLEEGKDVYFFVHHIDDYYMPFLCKMFHDMLSTRIKLPPLLPNLHAEPKQQSLF